MTIKEIIEAKKEPYVKLPNSVSGKHKFNGNYDADKFKVRKKQEEKTVREKVAEEVVELAA